MIASLFSVFHDVNASARELNDEMKRLVSGFSNGKWVLTQTPVNKPRKLSLVAK